MSVKKLEFKAVLLAAGKGKRLGAAYKNMPKPLVEIANGCSILEYTLRSMSEARLFDSVVVVVGYKHSAIKGLLEKLAPEMSFELDYVVNLQYATRSVLYSVEAGLGAISRGNIAVINGDTIFSPAIFHKIKQDVAVRGFPQGGVVGSVRNTLDDDDVKLQLDDSGRILHVGKNLKPTSAVSAGIVLISSGLRFQYENKLRGLKELKNVIHHDIIEALCLEEIPITFIEVPQGEWFEVDTISDVLFLKERLRHQRLGGQNEDINGIK
jgi:choline kinase